MNRSFLILSFALLLFLSPAFVPRSAHAASYLPGVLAGQYVDFPQVTEYSNGTLSPGTNFLENISSIHNLVQSVSGYDVTAKLTITFSNGTAPRTQAYSGNVLTGIGNLTLLILSGGLGAGDRVYQSGQLGITQTVINETVARSYAGAVRSVNVWNQTLAFGGYFEKFAFYWDVQTGFLLELSESGLIPSSPVNPHHTRFIIDATVATTNAWTSSATGDFSLDASPSVPARIAPGESLSYNLNLTSFNGFSGAVGILANLIASNSTVTSPPTLSLQTSSVVLASGGSGTDLLTITSATSSATGLYIITVSGSVGSLSHSAQLTFRVASASSAFDYSLSNSGPISIPDGGTGSVTIGATLTSGTSQSVTLSCLTPALPTGVSCTSFTPPSITPAVPPATSILSISVASSVAAGSYAIVVEGTPPAATPIPTVVSLTVTGSGPFDYSLLNNGPVTIGAGGSDHVSIAAFLSGGTAQPVTLSCVVASLPAGITCGAFTVNPVTPSPTYASSDLTINVASTVVAGSYSLVVGGNPAGATSGNTTTVGVTVTAKHTTTTSVPAVSCAIPLGGGSCTAMVSATVSDTTSSSTAPSGVVTFSLTPGTTSGTLDSPTCTLSTFSSVTNCSVTFTGTSTGYGYVTASYGGDASHETSSSSVASVTVTAAPKEDTATVVADASCNIASGSLSCSTSMSATVTDPTTPSNIPQGTVTFSLSTGTTGAHMSSSMCTLAAGTCSITITATGAGVATVIAEYGGDSTHNGSVSPSAHFTVNNSNPTFDYTLSVSPSSASVTAGAGTSATITVTLKSGNAGPIGLAASISPTPAACTVTNGYSPCGSIAVTPIIVTPASPGATSTLTIDTTNIAPPGIYTVTVTGSPAGTSPSTTTFTLTITAPYSGTPDFAIGASPSSLTIQAGYSGSSTISIIGSNGFYGSVGLTATVSPSGPTVSLSSGSLAAGSGTSTLSLTVGDAVAAGTYTVTIHGVSGSLSHDKQITVTVTAAQGAAPSNSNILGLAPTTFYALIGVIAVAIVAGSLVVVLRMRKPQAQA